VRALDEDAEDLVLTIIRMRAFAHAKVSFDAHAKDTSKKKRPLERTPMIKLVEEILFEEARQSMPRETEP
jgi:hypothetical protein